MKNLIILLVLFISLSTLSAQSLVNEVDEFTKKETVKTSDEYLVKDSYNRVEYYIASNSDLGDYSIMVIRTYQRRIFGISSDDEISILFTNEEVMTLKPNESDIATNVGNWYVSISIILLEKEQLETFSELTASKIRIGTISSGYIESVIKEKRAEKLKKAANLLLNRKM